MSVERIIVETNDETGNNPVEYDWEFYPDGTFHMSGDGEIPAAFEESAAIVDAFNHVNMSIVNGERTPLKDGDRAWFTLLAVTLATLIPFVEGKDGDRVGFMMGDTSNGFNINITSPEFRACCRSMWVGADVYRAFGRYLNFRWDTIREAWVENGSGLAFIGRTVKWRTCWRPPCRKATASVSTLWRAGRTPSDCSGSCWKPRNARTSRSDSQADQAVSNKTNNARDNDDSIRSGKTEVSKRFRFLLEASNVTAIPLQDLLGEDSPPLVCGEESPFGLGSFLLGLDVSSDGVLADVPDASEVGRWRP